MMQSYKSVYNHRELHIRFNEDGSIKLLVEGATFLLKRKLIKKLLKDIKNTPNNSFKMREYKTSKGLLEAYFHSNNKIGFQLPKELHDRADICLTDEDSKRVVKDLKRHIKETKKND